MGGRVTLEAGRLAAHELGHDRLLRLGVEKLLRLAVATETTHVGVRRGDLDGEMVGSGGVVPDVAEPAELGPKGATEAVVGMAGVALVLTDVAVLEVGRGQGVALDVLEVAHE